MNTTYYIYEVPGIKNGATKYWDSRSQYNFETYNIEPIIVETMEGPDNEDMWQIVGDREWELADLNGYRRGDHYLTMCLNGIKGGNKRSLMSDMRGEQQRSAWDNYTEEERTRRGNKTRLGKIGVKATNQHKKALSDGSKIFNDELVQDIRADLNSKLLSCRAIARKYNCSLTPIYNIRDQKKGY